MARQIIAAESSALTAEDTRKRGIVTTVVQAENQRLVDIAKQLATLSFSAIGVVLALNDKWLTETAPAWSRTMLGIAVVLYLGAVALTIVAAGAYVHRFNLSDYGDADAELHRVATIRFQLTRAGLIVMLLATVLVAIVALST